MACGIGVCMTCVLPVVGEDGRTRFVRSCVEGPVFDGDRVRWADVGTLPPDLVGADAMGVLAPHDVGPADDGTEPVDMSPLGPCRSRTRSSPRPAARRPAELRAVLRPRPRSAPSSPSRSAAAAVRTADAADGRDAERHAQLDRPAGPGHRRVPRQRPGLAARAGARTVVSIAGTRARTTSSSPGGCAASPACSGSR